MTTSPYAAALRRAFELSLAYLDGVDEAPGANVIGAPELRARFGGPLPETGVDPNAAIEQLASGVDGGLTASVGPRFSAAWRARIRGRPTATSG